MAPRNETAPEPCPHHASVPGRESQPEARRERGRNNHNAGLRAEVLAAAALERDGWRVLRRRVRTAAGEIDLVAERPGAAEPLLCFVEVKRRRSLGDAAAALSSRQAARLLAAAELLLAAEPGWTRHGVRFDLVLVDPCGRVRRIRDALRLEN